MKIGDISYILTLITLISVFIGIYFLLRQKSKDMQFKILLIWCFINFALHFLKQLVYLDANQLSKSTADNICSVSTIVFPLIMLIKKEKHFTKDFMYFIGVIGGLAGMLYPTEVLGKELFRFESIRFYFCHFSLFAIPFLLAIFNITRPRLKAVLYIPLAFAIYQFIILINTAIVCFTGMVTREGFTPLQLFMSSQYQNSSFTFGPTPDMGGVGKFIGSLCPKFMKTDLFNLNGGNETYWPAVWLIIPTYILFTPLYLLLGSPFIFRKNKNK